MKFLFFIPFFFIIFSCSETTSIEASKSPTPDDLIAHTSEFKKEVIEVTEGVHVAIGYALANAILVEGENSNIIIDTTGTIETAREVKALFDAINSNPIEAIIYTHNHGDHTYGATVFAEDSNPDIYAHDSTEEYLSRVIGIIRPIISARSNRMFGNSLPKSEVENNGIGPFLEIGRDGRQPGLLYPTKTFSDKIKFEVGGVKVELFHAPGETNDQLFVWLPEKKALFPGDNFYKTFPNLYTIRGTPYRDLAGWVNSIDMMRYLQPEFLIPSHTRPLVGQDNINEILTTYRDGIQFVHDQTVRLMNLGLGPDDIAETLVLPKHLGDSPFLKEFYGSPEWSAKNVFSGYLGWFNGNPSSLKPLPQIEEAENFIKACQYPPRGYRSFGPIRANIYGGPDYSSQADNEILKLAMIETKEALEKLDEILDTPNLDGIYIGPADLSLAVGEEPGFDKPENSKAFSEILRILEAAKKKNLLAGLHNGTPEYAQKMIDKGFNLVTVGSDSRYIASGAKSDLAKLKGKSKGPDTKGY